MKKQVWLSVILLIGLATLAPAGCGTPELGTADNPIVMAFVPSLDSQEVLASGDAIATMLQEETGLVVEPNVGTDFAAVREAMGAGQAHIGWLSSFNYVLAAEKYGVEAHLVTERYGSTSCAGQINVRADGEITILEDLKGKVMCWVNPNSTSGYIIPRIMPQANGVTVSGIQIWETSKSGPSPTDTRSTSGALSITGHWSGRQPMVAAGRRGRHLFVPRCAAVDNGHWILSSADPVYT